MECETYGHDFPDDLTRIEQLAEAIRIFRGFWMEEKFSFEGDHYSVKNVVSFPKPLRKPHPRIRVGTMHGRRRMFGVAAGLGDETDLARTFKPADCRRIFKRLDDMIAIAGHSPKDVDRSVALWTGFFDTEKAMNNGITEAAKERGVTD